MTISRKIWITFSLFCLCCIFHAITGDFCGKPGSPSNGHYNPIKNLFNESEEITYYCDWPSYSIIGSSRRICLKNGTWNDRIPYCESNLAFKKKVYYNQCSENQNFVDNNRYTFCQVFSNEPVTIDLQQNYSISYVVLVLNRHQSYSLTIEVQRNRDVYQCKAIKNEVIDEEDVKFVCNGGQPLMGSKIILKVNTSTPVYDIGVYTNTERKTCGDPDIPNNGVFDIRESRFSCFDGYLLMGDSTTYCVNGQWNTTGQLCVSQPPGWMGCGVPGLPANGDRYIGGKLQNESSYFCRQGFVIAGNPLRGCLLNGTWAPPIPKCVTNVALNKQVSHQIGVEKKGTSVDGNLATCETQEANFYGYIDLEKITPFNNINFTIKTNYATNISIFAANNTQSLYALYQYPKFKNADGLLSICTIHKVQPTTSLVCNHAAEARYIVLHFDKLVNICEVVVFNTNEVTDCGEPDQPLHGRIVNRSSSRTLFACELGYTLNGSSVVNCIKGNWVPEPPTCTMHKTTVRPYTSTSSRTSSPVVATTTTTHAHSEGEDSMSKEFLGIALGATMACLVIVLVAIVVFCLVRRHYKNRHRCDNDVSSKGSRSDYYTTSYRMPERRSGDGDDDVSIHLYDSIKDPEYLFPRRPQQLPDSVSNEFYGDTNSSIISGNFVNDQRHRLLPPRIPLYDSVAPEAEVTVNNRVTSPLSGPDDPLLDSESKPRTSL